MILFKCIKCGAVIDAQDQYAGCDAVCAYCNTEQRIPSESDSSCVLIFTEESPATGTPMTTAELNTRVEEGSVRPYDLIWNDGVWQPLCAVFEMGTEEETDTPPAGSQELAKRFAELEPLPGHEKLPKSYRPQSRSADAQKAPAKSGAGDSSKPGFSPMKLAVAILAAGTIVLCCLRLLNACGGRPARIILRNSTAENLQLDTPWAAEKKLNLPPGHYTTAPGMALLLGGNKTLDIAGNNGTQHIKVPMAPAYVTVVNLGSAEFPLLSPDFDAASLAGMVTQSGKTVVQQLQANTTPEAIGSLCDGLENAVKGKLLEYSSQECFFEKDVCLDLFIDGIGRNDIRLKKPRTANDRRPLLLPKENAGLTIGNGGTVTLSPKLACTGVYSSLGMVSMTIAGQISVSGEATLRVIRNIDRNEMQATLAFVKERTYTFAGQHLTGKWQCTMTRNGGSWRWNWELLDANGRCRLQAPQGQNPRLQ